jgi:hypothetical protein
MLLARWKSNGVTGVWLHDGDGWSSQLTPGNESIVLMNAGTLVLPPLFGDATDKAGFGAGLDFISNWDDACR